MRSSVVGILALVALQSGVASAACFDPRGAARAVIEPATAAELRTVRIRTLFAGGTIDLSRCGRDASGQSMVGHVLDVPDLSIELSRFAESDQLTFRIVSVCDTVLLVVDPEERAHFNDDSFGALDPTVQISSPRDGRYRIWLGTYQRAFCNATLIYGAN